MRTMTRFQHRKRSGATTVEFAITIPILLLILFTTLEFSRMNVIRQTAVNAAYEGARRGIVPGSTANEVEQIATGVLNTVGVHGSTITVTPTALTPDTTEVTVAECLQDAGIATGLFYTPVGGDIMFVETSVMDGKGELVLTGHADELAQRLVTHGRVGIAEDLHE